MHDAARSEPESAEASEAKGKTHASKPRIACLLVPALSLAAELRAEPELRGRPLAIASAPGPRGEVLACSPEAERAGVRVGSGVAHARAACAALALRVLSPAKERAAREALRDAALACAPRAELAKPATGFYAAEAAVFVDARGIGALYRSEAGFAAALALQAERLGLPAVVTIADTRGTALIAARLLVAEQRSGATNQQSQPDDETRARWKPQAASAQAGPRSMHDAARSEPESSEASEAKGKTKHLDARNTTQLANPVHVIPPGGDAAFLAPLALDLSNPDDALADALSRFGLRRVGDLLRVPERALLNRLGPALLPLLALARGEDAAPPPSAADAGPFEEGSELEAPVAQQEPLLFVLRGLLARLAERLACRGLAFGPLALACALEGGGRDVRTIGLAAPTLDVRAVLRLVALSLEAQPPSAAVDALHVSTEGAVLRGDQLDFFAPAGPSPAALSRTLAELAALCGAERVGAPALADDHRPDAFALAPFALREAKGATPARAAAPHAESTETARARAEPCALTRGLAVRALRPPLAAAVRSARGAPHWVQSALANGEVLRCAGPWRTTGQWWSEERYAFDHYDVLTSDGNVVRLRRDLLHERWEIDGVFD
jgi:protein ImuB